MNSTVTPGSAPRRIEPASPRELLLGWSDGNTFVVPYIEIRFHCPCAVCVDEMTGKRVIERASIASEVRPLEVHAVGRYAIQFSWSDGHSTGIYPYDRLIELCDHFGKAV